MENDFQDFTAQTGGRAAHYGKAWEEVPCIGLNKSGLVLNKSCESVLGLEPGNYVFLKFSPSQRVLLLKKAANNESVMGAYKVQRSDKGHSGSHITCKKLVATISDCLGRAFRARLDPGHPLFGRVISVLLSPENDART